MIYSDNLTVEEIIKKSVSDVKLEHEKQRRNVIKFTAR